MNFELVKLVKEYSEYGAKKRSVAGIIIGAVVLTALFFAVMCFIFARISKNTVLGALVGASLTFYAFEEACRGCKKYILKNIPLKRERHSNDIMLTRLYGLSQDEFAELALRSIKKRVPNIELTRMGIFYKAGDIYVVFLILAGKRRISDEKISMALSAGAKQIIVVCGASAAEAINKKFGDKIKCIITDKEIIAYAPELAYEAEKEKLSITAAIKRLCNSKNAIRLLKMSALCLGLSFVSSSKVYFTAFAVLLCVAGIALLVIKRQKNILDKRPE